MRRRARLRGCEAPPWRRRLPRRRRLHCLPSVQRLGAAGMVGAAQEASSPEQVLLRDGAHNSSAGMTALQVHGGVCTSCCQYRG